PNLSAGKRNEGKPSDDILGIPGPYPGKVVEVNHPGSVHQAKRDREVVKQMIARGMKGLVGSEDDVQAWRRFFQVGDRVGIKVVPVGQPLSISSFEVVQEIIAGLQSAGVRLRDILVFERYKDEFLRVGYHRYVPDGAHWECSSAAYDNAQLEIDGQLPGQPRQRNVAGYDPDVFREEPYCDIDSSVHQPGDDRRYRSHLSNIITRKVDKFISIPVLKDHRSAGVTLSLKNLSHGSVNNVARSHVGNASLGFGPGEREAAYGTMNQCNQFIPAMVSLPQTRQKAVLQIMDGLVGTYEGGPGNWNPTFATWEYKSLFFATDPVAIDRVGWEIIDAKRAEMGLSPVASMGLDADRNLLDRGAGPVPTEGFHIRQPQHVPLAATLGLGVFERKSIQHHPIRMG
ncbi:MAG: DUF362 domain-containing protein, partial [Pirellulaceae bacterium]